MNLSWTKSRILLWILTVLAVTHMGAKIVNNTQNRFSWSGPEFSDDLDVKTGIITVKMVEPDGPAARAGIEAGDQILSPEGKPFTGIREYARRFYEAKQSGAASLTVRKPDGTVVRKVFPLPVRDVSKYTFYDYFFYAAFILIPLMCLAIGLFICWMKWEDDTARFGGLLFLSLATQFQNTNSFLFHPDFRPFFLIYGNFSFFSGFLCFSFFSEFPARTAFADRFRWIRHVYLAVLVVVVVVVVAHQLAYSYSFAAARYTLPVVRFIDRSSIGFLTVLLGFLACFLFGFEKFRAKTDVAQLRRFRVMMFGIMVGCFPLMALVVVNLVLYRNTNLDKLPLWLLATAMILYTAFPLTFAYTVVTQRVLGVQQLLRKSLQYAFVSRGYLAVEFLMLYVLVQTATNVVERLWFKSASLPETVESGVTYVIVGFGLYAMWRVNPRLQTVIDRRFFREAYKAQQVLTELSRNVRQLTRSDEVLQQVAERVKTALHVERIAFFIQSPLMDGRSDGDHLRSFVCRFDLSPMCAYEPDLFLPKSSFVVRKLVEEQSPLDVYFDDPESWTAHLVKHEQGKYSERATEHDVLQSVSSNLLIPLSSHTNILGFLSLGPKLSEEPYTSEDKGLLMAVAEATAMKLENSQLIKRLLDEASLRREIEIAKTMQQSLLPSAPPELPGFEVSGYSSAANDVGGDYYDYFLLSPTRLAVAVGDVTGHGVSSGLLMACAKGGLLTLVGVDPSPKAVMYGLNNLIATAGNKRNLMTFAYAVVDGETRSLELANAGHPFPYQYRHASGAVESLEVTAYPLGVRRNSSFSTLQVTMQPGDCVVFYSDGIVEAQNDREETFGYDGLERTLAECGRLGADEIRNEILAAASRFTNGKAYDDDVTLLVVRALPTFPIDRRTDSA